MSEESGKVIKRRGLVKKHAAVDHEVWKWKMLQEQVKGSRVTKTEVQAYAVRAYQQAGVTNFKASDGWYRRWRVRWQQMASDAKPVQVAASDTIEVGSNFGCPITTKEVNPSIALDRIEKLSESQTSFQSADLKPFEKKLEAAPILVCEVTEKNSVESESPANSLNKETCHTEQVDSGEIPAELQQCKPSSQSSRCDLLTDQNAPDPKTGQDSLTFSANIQVVEEPTHESQLNKVESQASRVPKNPTDFAVTLKDTRTEEEPATNQQLSKSIEDEEKNKTKHVVVSALNDAIPPRPQLPLTPPSSSSSFDTYYTNHSLIYQNDFDFGDELFCDTCDDFHPRHPGALFKCHKRHKRTDSKLLLCGETKGKETAVEGIEEVLQLVEEESGAEEGGLVNPEVERARGKRYQDRFKSRVVTYALAHTTKMAALKFKVNRGTICEWICHRRRVTGADPKAVLTDVDGKSDDSDFLKWLEESKFNLTNERLKQKSAEWLMSESTEKSSQWLKVYAHRLNGSQVPSVKKRYIAYPDTFKRVAVFHAQTHSNMAAARVFGVARRRIVEWQAAAEASKSSDKQERFPGVTDVSVDREVFAWYSAQDPPPSGQQVRSKARQLYRAAGHSLQCGPGWYYRWRARHGLPPARTVPSAECRLLAWALAQMEVRRITHPALAQQAASLGVAKVSNKWTVKFSRRHRRLLQDPPDLSAELPAHLEQQACRFRLTLRPILEPTQLSRVISMDEVVLYFTPPEERAKKSVLWRPGLRSAHASIIVSCSADGTLLPSLIIFKGAVASVNNDDQQLVLCASSATGTINEDIFLKWINEVCLNRLEAGGSEGGVLVTDSLPLHQCRSGSRLLESRKLHHAVTPPGTSSRLLPVLPVCHLFKSMIEEIAFLSLDSLPSPLSSPSADQLLQWTMQVHNHVEKLQAENIRSAFQEMLFVQNESITAETEPNT